MARNFDGTDDSVDFGNIHNFSEADAWSALVMHRSDDWTGDESQLWSKSNGAGFRQLFWRVDTSGFTQVMVNDLTLIISSAQTDALSTDTWYLSCLTQTPATNLLKLYTLRLSDLVFVDDGDAGVDGTHDTDTGLTAACVVGRTEEGGDEYNGDMGFAAIVDGTMTKNEIRAYGINPLRGFLNAKARHGATVFAPLGLGSPEPDWSGNGNSGTVSGAIIGTNPPVAPFGLGYLGAIHAGAPAPSAPGIPVGTLQMMGYGI